MFLGFFSIISNAQIAKRYQWSPDFVWVNPLFIRGQFGYISHSFGAFDSLPARTAHGLQVAIEARLFSAIFEKKEGFAIYDALYCSLEPAIYTGERKLLPNAFGAKESMLSFSFNTGYNAVLGYRNAFFGLLGGMGFHAFRANLGSVATTAPSLLVHSFPLIARLELRPYFKSEKFLVLQATYHQKQRFDLMAAFSIIPERFWIFAANKQLLPPTTYDLNLPSRPVPFSQLMFGFRTGSMF